MLYVKIMSAEDMPDTNPHKNYSIIPVENDQVMQFVANENISIDIDVPSTPLYSLLVISPDGSEENHPLFGNAYVINEAGKTISSHGC